MATHAKPKTRSSGRSGGVRPADGARPSLVRHKPAGIEHANILQAKLKIGEPNDQYEREADRVADRVLEARAHSSSDGAGAASSGSPLQRQEKDEDEAAQTASLQREEADEDETAQTLPLQRQEKDEDETAQTVSLQREEADEDETAQTLPLQRQEKEEDETAQTASLQREDAGEEEEAAQARARPGKRVSGRPVGQRFEARLAELRRSGGAPMPDRLRAFVEPRFGRDFGAVRLHAGPGAAALAREAQARAFTVGHDIVFGAGEFQPGAADGRRLVAHELTHVLQQRGGLHLVQRELDSGGLDKRVRGAVPRLELRSFEDRFALAPNAAPPAILAIVRGIIRRTLLDGTSAPALAVFRPGGQRSAETERVIESDEYDLSLEAVHTGGAVETTWTLWRREPRQMLFTQSRTIAEEAGALEPMQDEERESLTLLTPPDYADDPAVAAGEPTPSAEGDIPATDREAAGLPIPSAAGERTAATTAPTIDTAALDTAPAEAQAAEVPEPSGAGQNAGADDPAAPRPPVDVEPGEGPVPEEEEEVMPAAVQRLGVGPSERGPAVLDRPLARELGAVEASGGDPVPPGVAALAGPAVGTDVSTVRLHHDARAGRLARAVRARAFTHGDHIVVAPAEYRPDTEPGLRLLAHELAHVRQQRTPAAGRAPPLQRQAEECPPPDPVPEVEVVPSPAGPSEDPAFQAVERRAENRGADQATHGDGDAKSAEASNAAEVKEGENRIHGEAAQVDAMEGAAANPPAFDKEAFIEKVVAEVARTAPKTMDAFLKFADEGKVKAVKTAVTGEVGAAQEKSQGPLAEKAAAPAEPGESPRVAGELDPEDAGAEPGSIRADRAMPPMRTDSEIDMSAETTRTENILKEACVTREFMEKHDDPVLKSGIAAQDEVAESAASSPAAFREEESGNLEGARSGASAEGERGVQGLHGARAEAFEAVGGQQGATKTDNEAKRDAASLEIDGIFTDTQTKVTERLEQLDTDVATTFDAGANAAVAKFERDMDAEATKHEKSWADKLADWLFGPPPKEQQDFYDAGRRVFMADMRVVVGDVANVVAKGLEDARTIVETGKKEVKAKLDSLGSDLDDFKSQKADEISDRFRSLEQTIADKEREVVASVAKQYVGALEKVKAAEDRIREAHKNFLEKAEDVYNEVKDAVLGWIEQLAAIVGGAARRIMHDPGKFLANLGAGIIQGFTMFMDSIGDNIKNAVVSWLTGNLAGGGIQVPASFDAKSLIGFLLDIAGLGVSSIKNIARKVFGAQIVGLVEKGVEGAEQIKRIFDILATEGPGGLLNFLASEFARIKDEVMGEIGKALAESLVIAGIKKVLGIISGLVSGGVGTVVTIVATIIDVVLWIRDNAAQLAELVSTIAGMATAVLEGQVAPLAGAINTVLKGLLPLVLGFVGALVGIGGVVSKIQKIFKAIRKPATKAITALFQKLKKALGKLFKKLLKKGKKKKGKKKKLSPSVVKRKIIAALKKPIAEEDPAKAIAEARSRADGLRSQYQPKLERGTIKIAILDRNPDDVSGDGYVDMDVALSPGSKAKAKVNVTPLKKFSKQISASHPEARDSIKESIEKIPKSKSNNWASAKSALSEFTPVSAIVARPAAVAHPFGRAMEKYIVNGVQRVDVGATAGQINYVKGQIDSAVGDFGKPNQLMKAAVFNARASTSKIEKTIESAYREAVRGKELQRPALREDTKKAIRDAARKTKNGDFIDPNPPLLIIPKGGPFHYGHKSGHEHRKLVKTAERKGMTQGQFNDWVNAHPKWFQIEDPGRNISHQFEA